MIHIKDLYLSNDTATGTNLYYSDKEQIKPFNGWVYDTFPDGTLMWEAEVKNGRQNGIEKHYYRNGQLEQENQMSENTICGTSREYYEDGQLMSESIVIRNLHVRSFMYDEFGSLIKYDEVSEGGRFYPSVKDELQKYAHLRLKGDDLIRTKE